jgi:hypothetical protein
LLKPPNFQQEASVKGLKWVDLFGKKRVSNSGGGSDVEKMFGGNMILGKMHEASDEIMFVVAGFA